DGDDGHEARDIEAAGGHAHARRGDRPAASHHRLTALMGDLPRFWIYMQHGIVICVLLSPVIVIVKLLFAAASPSHSSPSCAAFEFTATDISCKADCPPGYDPTTVTLHIRDLRKRKTAHVAGEVAPKGRLVLTTGGAIAWSQNTPTDVEIDAFDAAGRRQLD